MLLTIRRCWQALPTLACGVTLWMLGTPDAQAQLHKCLVNGTVTYQNTPCPATEPRSQPSVEQLNAERRKRLAQTSEAASSAAAAPAPDTRSIRPAPLPSEPVKPAARPLAALPEAAYRCDGRKHCSQMTSCAEATYFLKHCPTVKMDGDGDGIPCEQQWCFR